jgi:hypothetical protein
MNRLTRSVSMGAVSLIVLPACTTVDPGPDFERAADMTSTRTQVGEVYSPDAEDMIEAKVADLLAGGLTVDEAVCVAMLNNRSFQALSQEIGVSRAELVQSGLLTNPPSRCCWSFLKAAGDPNSTSVWRRSWSTSGRSPFARRLRKRSWLRRSGGSRSVRGALCVFALRCGRRSSTRSSLTARVRDSGGDGAVSRIRARRQTCEVVLPV